MTKSSVLRRKAVAQSEELDRLKGFPEDGRKTLLILSNDYARVMLLPDRNRSPVKQLHESKFGILKNLARSRPTVQEKSELLKKIRSENLIREQKLKEQRTLLEKEKLRAALFTPEKNKETMVREEHHKKRFEALKLEDEDIMKIFNSEISRAKCSAILQKQIKQNNLKQKKFEEEEENLEKDIMKMNETLYHKRRAEEDERKRKRLENYTDVLAESRKIKEIEKSLRNAEIEQEATKRDLLVAHQHLKDIERMKKVEEDRKNLLQQQKDLMLTARILKQKQREEDKLIDDKLRKIRIQQEEQQNIAKENFNKRVEAKFKDTDLVSKKKKEEEKLLLEAEEFARRRSNNDIDKKWRQKEKERIVNEQKKKMDFLEGIRNQVEDKVTQKTKEILDEMEDARRIEKKLKELDIQTEKSNKKKLDEKKELAEYLQKEAQAKVSLKKLEEIKIEKDNVELKLMELRRKEMLEKALDDKIQNLKSYDMDERLIDSVKHKADVLKAKY